MHQETTAGAFLSRIASLDDIDSLVALVNGAYRGDSGRRGWTTEADLIDGQRVDAPMLVEMVEQEASSIIIVESEEAGTAEIVGCVHVRGEHGAGSAPRAHFGLLTVAVDRQRQGIGDRLLAEAETFARERFGAREMMMHVISIRAPLIAWYERRGYRKTGEKAAFPYGEPRFGLPLRDDLEFILMAKTLI